MPIRPDLLPFYGKTWKEVTRPRILARAGNKCEQCGKPNGIEVYTATDPYWRRMWWRPVSTFSTWRDCEGGAVDLYFVHPRKIRVVLTVAHLDHTAGHDDDDNLKALCQWCHLNYDQLHHKETRQDRKDAARPLLRGMQCPR